MSTLFERIGGKPAVEAAVDKLYLRLMTNEKVSHFFAGIDMNKQREHLASFLTYAFGGKTGYDGRSMRQAHQRLVEHLGLTDTHFDALIENIVATLRELNVPEDLIIEVAQITESVRGEVLNH
ncbi:MAG: group 1 truncated hemoglobin [Mastigocoleus sp. MO_167.B18]|uniref:group I truncated hemoglobin n=1 Tax=Mastigocoleus sp. MO_188.B34 TaxID=3036635 RepID=UPI00262D3A3B|nr:group 1 truncated hemoglobin [Mastigocoleus sp. MO_188.B34]MDJ0695722.1 group 1 truncated hemoglobin [Mastigocoleus sp. MO_188.B34]MDJ0774790.1 group 1 truncated hemoglobin [Mastigocoleus sp. MO_167.B18]